MTSSKLPPLDIPALLRRHGLRPDKKLGQNFLEDSAALESIVSVSGIQPDDTVLEVGPGLGSLTRLLASSCERVIAVELDSDLIPPLKSVLAPFNNVQVIQGDILKLPLSALISKPGYLVVANIPYYITSAIIRRLLESEVRPRRIVLTIQKEVAERICAAPGDLSLLALSVQVYGQPEIKAVIPAAAFRPAPQVDSAVLSVDIYPEPRIPRAMLPAFFFLIKAGFAQKRKTLRNSLSAGLHLSKSDAEALLRSVEIDPMRRAETLTLDEWRRLAAVTAPLIEVISVPCLRDPPRFFPQFPQVPVIPQHLPDASCRFHLDPQRHLRLPPAPVREINRCFADPVFQAVRQVDHLHQEDIAIGLDPLQRHPLQRLPPPHAVSRGHIPQRHPQDRPRIEIPERRERLPPCRPVMVHRAAAHITRAQHHIARLQQPEHLRQRGRVMREIRIHLHHRARLPAQRHAESFNVGRAQPHLPRPVQHTHAPVRLSQLVRDPARAVRAVVVHHQHVQVKRKRK